MNRIISFGKGMQKSNVPSFAASCAFYFFLSLFPILMFICSLIPYLPITEPDFVNMVSSMLPSYLSSVAKSLINQIYRASSGVLPVTVVMTLWTAGMGIMSLIRGLNSIYKVDDNRNYFLIRILGSVYTLLFLAAVAFMIVLGAFGKTLGLKLIDKFPHLSNLLFVLIFFRVVIIWVLLTVILNLAYAFLPARNQKFFHQLPGAVIASLAWCVVTWGFSVYIDKFHGFSMYGSLMGIIIFLFWLNIGFNLVMFGAYFNRRFDPYLKVGIEQRQRIKMVREGQYNFSDDVDNDEN